MKSRILHVFPVILVIGIAVAAIYYLRTLNPDEKGPLQGSGTIESLELGLAMEMNGRVAAVFVEKGDRVTAGQLLVTLEDQYLEDQLAQARAALTVAEANYNLIVAGKTPEQAQAALAGAALEVLAARQGVDQLHNRASLALAQAEFAVATAQKAIEDAEMNLEAVRALDYSAAAQEFYGMMILAQDELNQAQEAYDRVDDRDDDDPVRAAALIRLAKAQQDYERAVLGYNNLNGKTNALDISLAEAALTGAQAQLADLQKKVRDLQDGPDPELLAIAEARLEAAEAQLALAKSPSPTPEQLAVAQAQVGLARANLAAFESQMARTRLTAPMDGVITARLFEPGEVALPNSPVLIMANVDDLSITVFIPEDQYGRIQLGQTAQVFVNSFPGESFEGQVVYIADAAEFTPRNVQTAEGRRTTVFAVELKIVDTAGRLKPGMPADVIFALAQ